MDTIAKDNSNSLQNIIIDVATVELGDQKMKLPVWDTTEISKNNHQERNLFNSKRAELKD